ncbi:MAG: hypothetical protein A3B70_08065 [Deltaproteobacteria bacterium RIFCSPHIGHO2_02_FULL_40_11]|nr:MAG: hypothetical protein A3B70_08065 [Deltaproteobacteria bacterium RIFCSPHIGHO2_02_FULL_40_11]
MALFFLNIFISATAISFCAWLSNKYPVLAGFMIALPLSTLLVLPLSYFQYQDPQNTITLAKSILVALPITFLFFVPFFLSQKFSLSFWACYGLGILFLGIGFVAHKLISQWV